MLPLGCAHEQAHAYCVHTNRHRKARTQNKSKEFELFYCLFSLLPLLFFTLSVSTPAVTRCNPQSNDCHSLTLIKGAQLTRGPRVAFIRWHVKVCFSLALNTTGADRRGARTWGGCSCRCIKRRFEAYERKRKNLWRVICFVCYLFC